MTVEAVAGYLALTQDEFEARSAAGEFDAFVAEGVWTVADAESAYQHLYGRGVECDPVAAAKLITEVRRVAEGVRAYGDMPEPDNVKAGRGGVAYRVSFDLDVIAARMESMLRGTVLLDMMSAAALSAKVALWGEKDTSQFEVERRISLSFDVVDSIVPPVDVDDARRVAEMQSVCAKLDEIREALLRPAVLGDEDEDPVAAMSTAAGRGGAYLLGVQRDVVAAHIEALEARRLAVADGGSQA
jgi:hypothetical protein